MIDDRFRSRTSKVTGRGVDVDERSERAALIPFTDFVRHGFRSSILEPSLGIA